MKPLFEYDNNNQTLTKNHSHCNMNNISIIETLFKYEYICNYDSNIKVKYENGF